MINLYSGKFIRDPKKIENRGTMDFTRIKLIYVKNIFFICFLMRLFYIYLYAKNQKNVV
ncbi:hypothetical protein HanIR_Chr12g0568001 [Helianthus annuus]|nr:hypothetical protein HanIR_Chr12g0568001 [Helianthus annuus]